jgi:hypothetical protein
MEHNQDEFYDITQAIQKDCHDFVDMMVDNLGKKGKLNKGTNQQDFINIFFYKKLADIELRLRSLERKTTISYN